MPKQKPGQRQFEVQVIFNLPAKDAQDAAERLHLYLSGRLVDPTCPYDEVAFTTDDVSEYVE